MCLCVFVCESGCVCACLCVSVCVWACMCQCVNVCQRSLRLIFLLISSTGHHWLSRQCFHVKRKCNSRCESVKYYCHHYNIWYLHWLCCRGKRYKREPCNYYWINIKLLKGFDNYRIDICYAHIFKILHGVRDSLSPRACTGLELNLHTARKFDNSFDIRIRYCCHVNCVASFWRENGAWRLHARRSWHTRSRHSCTNDKLYCLDGYRYWYPPVLCWISIY